MSHKYSGATRSDISIFKLFQKQNRRTCPPPSRQHDNFVISCENVCDQKSGVNTSQQGNLEFSHFAQDHDYCRIPPRKTECGSRLGVQKFLGFERMEIKELSLSKNDSKEVHASNTSFFQSPKLSSSKLLCLESRPSVSRVRRVLTGLERDSGLCLSSILSDRKCFSKSKERTLQIINHNPNLAKTKFLLNTSGNVNSTPHFHQLAKDLLRNSQGDIHPLVQNRQLRLVAWTISPEISLQQAYRRKLLSLSQMKDDQAQFQITSRPGESSVADVVNNKLIPFDVI